MLQILDKSENSAFYKDGKYLSKEGVYMGIE